MGRGGVGGGEGWGGEGLRCEEWVVVRDMEVRDGR